MRTFLVWCPEMGAEREDAYEIEAFDAEGAAKEWADTEDSYSAEYSIVSGRDTPVVYVAEGDGSVHSFRVSGEAVATYYATAIKDGSHE